MNNQFKHFRIPPEGMETFRKYVETLDRLRAELIAIQEEYQAKADAVQARGRAQMETMWYQLSTMVGIDGAASWDSPDWGVERRYLESDFGAIIYNPQAHNPLQAVLMGQSEEPDEQGPPPGATVN